MLKYPYNRQTIYRVSAIPTQTPNVFFTEIEETILKFMRNHKDSE